MNEEPLTDAEIKKLRKILGDFVVFSKTEVVQIKKLLEGYRALSWIGKVLTNVLIWGMTIGFGLPQLIELLGE